GSRRPFTRRRYALLLLVLTVLDDAEAQTTVGQIAEKLAAVIDYDPALEGSGWALDLNDKTDREDLVHALRLLIHLGVLRRIDGDEGCFVSSRQGDALYDINAEAANSLLAPRRAPSQINATGFHERYAAVAFDTPPTLEESDTARVRRVRQNLYRRLLDDPVVYFADLPRDEYEYFTGQRPRILQAIENATGLPAEVRAEGVALLDLTGRATDARLPEEGTDGHVCLLAAEYLARARQRGEHAVSRAQLQERVAGWVAQYGRAYWRKDACAPGAEAGLVETALSRLYGLGLIDLAGPQSDVVPLPALARYRVESFRAGGKV
ncbi:MAG: TIGR02678 family protein, partial [Planctomycetota bacterium]